jgi:hypothetical protein
MERSPSLRFSCDSAALVHGVINQFLTNSYFPQDIQL